MRCLLSPEGNILRMGQSGIGKKSAIRLSSISSPQIKKDAKIIDSGSENWLNDLIEFLVSNNLEKSVLIFEIKGK